MYDTADKNLTFSLKFFQKICTNGFLFYKFDAKREVYQYLFVWYSKNDVTLKRPRVYNEFVRQKTIQTDF